MSEYEQWPLCKLRRVMEEVRGEMFKRECPTYGLPWVVEIVDETIPYVVRREESFLGDTAGVCFAVTGEGWRSASGRLTTPDAASMRAAVTLCHWLSWSTDATLAAARRGEGLGSFAWHLTHLTEDPYEMAEGYEIFVGTTCVTVDGRGMDEQQTRHAGTLMERCLRNGVPPSDEELAVWCTTEGALRALL